MNQISPADWTQARKTLSLLEERWLVIQPSDALRAEAGKMVERYDLRAADAFQLAAALEWCEDAPQGRVFLTADDKLLQAAMLSGFDAQRV
jgi:predicted nucleic acid-binding protein